VFFAPNDARGQTDAVARDLQYKPGQNVHSWRSSSVAPEVDRLRTRQSTDRPRNLTVPPFTAYRRGALRLSSMTGLVRRNPHQWVKQSRSTRGPRPDGPTNRKRRPEVAWLSRYNAGGDQEACSRANNRASVGDQALRPSAVGMPASFSLSAMARKLVTPSACSLRMIGASSAVRASARFCVAALERASPR
jgi:hypothetical protein